jgi:hypothetical protein
MIPILGLRTTVSGTTVKTNFSSSFSSLMEPLSAISVVEAAAFLAATASAFSLSFFF